MIKGRFCSAISALALMLTGASGALAQDENGATELDTYEGGRNRTRMDKLDIEIERPQISIESDFSIDSIKPPTSLGKIEMEPVTMPEIGAAQVAPSEPAEPAPQQQAPQQAPVQQPVSRPPPPVPRQNAGATPSLPSPAGPTGPSRRVVPLETNPPAYPREAALDGTQGYVVLEFTVDVEGETTDIQVVEAQPRGVFEREARRAVSRWRFQPALNNGQPIPQRLRQRLNFSLD